MLSKDNICISTTIFYYYNGAIQPNTDSITMKNASYGNKVQKRKLKAHCLKLARLARTMVIKII